ncbi:MAG: substrate-binding domain-containing protein [Sphingobacteriales bacterium]|nr:substrate-binding domain-containing protein [Sphingobacteriales bacterium]
MQFHLKSILLYLTVVLLPISCTSKKSDKEQNQYDWNTGSVVIVADSNLSYVLEQLIPIYENFYPAAEVSFKYTSEDIAISDFKNKKNTIIAIEKSLTADEITVAAHNQDAKILENTFAYDAIAVIANKSFKDSVFVVENTVSFLTTATVSKLVFDNSKSGIARAIMQLSKTDPSLFKNAYSLNSVSDVLKYVSNNANAIGFIPYNLLSNRNEKEAQAIRANFKFLSVSYRDTITAISQESIAQQQYPLVRPISIYIGNCPDLAGQGFTNFLFKQQISKALLLSGLVPKNIPAREVNVTDEFNPEKTK